MAVVTETEARKIINEGEEVYCVYSPHRVPVLFDDCFEAWRYADKLSTKFERTFHVLDWETGEYA